MRPSDGGGAEAQTTVLGASPQDRRRTGAASVSDEERSKMEIDDQREPYDLFWVWTLRPSAGVAGVLVLMYLFLT